MSTNEKRSQYSDAERERLTQKFQEMFKTLNQMYAVYKKENTK